MFEALGSRIRRYAVRFYPCYRRTGVRVLHVSADFREIRIKLPLNWKTRGFNGTTFGGSIYGCIDPVYMTMLSMILGEKYIVWDRAATIDFIKPGRSALYATFQLAEKEIEQIRAELETAERIQRAYSPELVDEHGVLHAKFSKTIVIKKRESS
jgi:Domain of unknown function (DUF4442)